MKPNTKKKINIKEHESTIVRVLVTFSFRSLSADVYPEKKMKLKYTFSQYILFIKGKCSMYVCVVFYWHSSY